MESVTLGGQKKIFRFFLSRFHMSGIYPIKATRKQKPSFALRFEKAIKNNVHCRDTYEYHQTESQKIKPFCQSSKWERYNRLSVAEDI